MYQVSFVMLSRSDNLFIIKLLIKVQGEFLRCHINAINGVMSRLLHQNTAKWDIIAFNSFLYIDRLWHSKSVKPFSSDTFPNELIQLFGEGGGWRFQSDSFGP